MQTEALVQGEHGTLHRDHMVELRVTNTHEVDPKLEVVEGGRETDYKQSVCSHHQFLGAYFDHKHLNPQRFLF